jgi:hypothetical protein
MSSITKAIDILLEDDQSGWEIYSQATELYNELESAKLHVQNLMHKLHGQRQKMCMDLSYRLRKRNPSFNISVDRNGCRIGYRKKSLTFRPDLGKGIWQVLSKDEGFANLFKRKHRSSLLINHDIGEFVDTIYGFFRDNYKTLQEESEGQGVILVDGVKRSLADFSSLVKTCIRS